MKPRKGIEGHKNVKTLQDALAFLEMGGWAPRLTETTRSYLASMVNSLAMLMIVISMSSVTGALKEAKRVLEPCGLGDFRPELISLVPSRVAVHTVSVHPY